MDCSFTAIRISVHAGHLDGLIAGIINRPGQRLLQLFRSFGALLIASRRRVLDDRFALPDMGQTSNQDQNYCIHPNKLVAAHQLLADASL
jgi:hypothetical protein